MQKKYMAILPLFVLLGACGGGGGSSDNGDNIGDRIGHQANKIGDKIADAVADVTRGVWWQAYEDSCAGKDKTVEVKAQAGDTVKMSIRVQASGDVKPLSAEWSGDGSSWQSVLGAVNTLTYDQNPAEKDHQFTYTLPVQVQNAGEMAFKLVIKDKNGDERYSDTCKVKVNM